MNPIDPQTGHYRDGFDPFDDAVSSAQWRVAEIAGVSPKFVRARDARTFATKTQAAAYLEDHLGAVKAGDCWKTDSMDHHLRIVPSQGRYMIKKNKLMQTHTKSPTFRIPKNEYLK